MPPVAANTKGEKQALSTSKFFHYMLVFSPVYVSGSTLAMGDKNRNVQKD